MTIKSPAFSVREIRRQRNPSPVKLAAKCAAERLFDTRMGTFHDGCQHRGLQHAEILLPGRAPAWASERASLWNEVDRVELRQKRVRVALEITLNFPDGLGLGFRIELAQGFVARELVGREMAADLTLRERAKKGGGVENVAFVLVPVRPLDPDGFGRRESDWFSDSLHWRWMNGWLDTTRRAIAIRDAVSTLMNGTSSSLTNRLQGKSSRPEVERPARHHVDDFSPDDALDSCSVEYQEDEGCRQSGEEPFTDREGASSETAASSFTHGSCRMGPYVQEPSPQGVVDASDSPLLPAPTEPILRQPWARDARWIVAWRIVAGLRRASVARVDPTRLLREVMTHTWFSRH